MKKINYSNIIIWLVYLALLAVLLPHTAWAFSRFEPLDSALSGWTAWAAAFTFESAIAVFTHKQARHIESIRVRKWWPRFVARYINAYSFGLITAVFVSTIANVLHAKSFAASGYDTPLFIGAFGGILPLASLIFARVLSNVNDVVQEADPELQEAHRKIKVIRTDLQAASGKINELANERDQLARERDEFARKNSDLQEARELWQSVNEQMQAAIRYNAGKYETLQEAANDVGVSESTISRLAKSANGVTK